MLSHFKSRLLLSYLLVLGVVAAVFLPLMSLRVRSLIQSQTAERLRGQAHLAAEDILPLLKKKNPGKALQAFARRYEDLASCRFTVVDPQGRVLADSEVETDKLASLENHAGRPEILAAKAGGWGWSVRHSATVGRDFLYGALAFPFGKDTAFVRLAVPLQDTQEIAWHFREVLWFGFGLAVLAAGLLSWGLALFLSNGITRLSQAASRIAQGEFSLAAVSTGTRELDTLAEALAAMSQSLKQSFQNLEEEKDLLNATLEGMTEGVLALDSGGRVLFLNSPAEDILRLPQAQAQGHPLHEVLRNADLSRLLDDARGRAEGLSAGEITLIGPPERVFAVHVTSFSGGAAKTSGVIVVLSDVTELKRLLRLRSEFVANVSHEIKTPLTAIRASLETLADGALDDPAVNRDFLGKASRHTDRLSALIDDLLTLSEIEDRQKRGLAPSSEAVVAESIAASWGLLEARAAARQVFLVSGQAGGLKVKMEPASLVRVFNNLLDNAVKYSPAKGEVRLEIETSGKTMKVWVKDQGPGIAPEELPRLFERFYRVDKARSRELGGTGLGLSIVKHLVESAGGQVGVESAPEKGSAFWFTLPVL